MAFPPTWRDRPILIESYDMHGLHLDYSFTPDHDTGRTGNYQTTRRENGTENWNIECRDPVWISRDTNPGKKLTFGRAESTRKTGKPPTTWVDDVERDLVVLKAQTVHRLNGRGLVYGISLSSQCFMTFKHVLHVQQQAGKPLAA